MGYSSGAVIALKGRDSVAIACDTRYGKGLETISTNFPRIYQINKYTWLAIAGLGTDIQTIKIKLVEEARRYRIDEGIDMEPHELASFLSTLLYKHRFAPFYCSPIVVGLSKDNVPYIATMDLIGCMDDDVKFAVGGSCSESLYGLSEAMYMDNLPHEELAEMTSKIIKAAVNRDSGSGWGCQLHIVTPKQIIIRDLETRMD